MVSDFVLGGALIGATVGFRTQVNPTPSSHTWLGLWLLLFTCGAISAFSQGWYLQFAPQRLMAVLGKPLSVDAAIGVQTMFKHWPRLARLHLIGALLCGITSIVVALLFIQGSFLCMPAEAPYATFRPHWMSERDAELSHSVSINAGHILAPPPFGDVLAAYERSNAVAYGRHPFRPTNWRYRWRPKCTIFLMPMPGQTFGRHFWKNTAWHGCIARTVFGGPGID